VNACISAVQHIRRLRGGSQSQLLRASDGAYYVCKFLNNPQHTRVLANEMLATRLGRLLGLPMPEVEVIDVSAWLIEHSTDFRIDLAGSRIPCTPGRHFGSLYVEEPESSLVVDYLPDELLRAVSNIDDFPRVVVLDKWTCNADGRQAVFAQKKRERKFSATFIDQGYCFNAGEWSFPDSPLRGVFAKNCVYENVHGWDDFEPALTRAEEIAIDKIWQIATAIPAEWYEFDSDGLHRLVETLHHRRSIIRDVITQFRSSSRDPFPLWTSQ
jgi:hypothetical protein